MRQENCDDGIGRPDCEADLEVNNDAINEISETLDFEDIIINIEEFLQNSIDYLFYMFQ